MVHEDKEHMMAKIVSSSEIEIAGKLIKFPCSIMRDPDGNPFIVEINGRTLVVFYPRTQNEAKSLADVDMERNIWAFDEAGELIWKVAAPTLRPNDSNPYTSVFLRSGKVFGGNMSGYDFEIDIADGTVNLPKNPGRPW
jgi:hypothetical protein